MGAVASMPWPQRRWWPAAVALVAVGAALGMALLVPRLFSDPVGVDPYLLRLSAVAVALAGFALAVPRLAPARPVLLAVAAITASFSVFTGGPQWIVDLAGGRFDGNAQVLLASAGQVGVTAALAILALRAVPDRLRAGLRLTRFGRGAIIAATSGSVVLLLVVMALPATLLGRVGLAPVAIGRDLPLQGPADVLQAVAQELQFRGLLLGALELVMPRWVANLAQAAFFGLAHIAVVYQGPGAAFVPVTIGLGWVLGWVTQRTGSLWPAIVIHAVALLAVSVGVVPGLYGS